MSLWFETECSARSFLASKPQVSRVDRATVCLSGCLSYSNICCHFLARVFHIDSNPSGTNDSGPDFSKAFTVSDIKCHSSRFCINKQVNDCDLCLYQATRDPICCITATDKTLVVVCKLMVLDKE